MRLRLMVFGVLLLAAIGLQPARPVAAAQRCFTETNQCMDGRIAEFWEQNGGLAVFGFPIGPQEQTTVDGKTFTVQRFERNRLELHPENARPYDVLLGRLGADRLAQQGRDWFGFAKSGDTGGCRVFPETGHSVCGAILKAWRANGLQIDGKKAVTDAESLALFGMPLSGVLTETLSDGKQYQVQWFERARFELHPENAAPYDVLLGLLGNEVGGGTAPAPAAAAAPAGNSPGSLFVPLYKRMFASYMLEQWGYKLVDWDMKWEINSSFAKGLNDGTGVVHDANDWRDNLVQSVDVTTGMYSPSGDYWGLVYYIVEFTNEADARTMYYDIDIESSMATSQGINYYSPSASCLEQWAVGSTESGVTLSVLKMRCGNKLLKLNVLGNGDSTEFLQLFAYIDRFFVGSFSW
jgi:hypothetical protein